MDLLWTCGGFNPRKTKFWRVIASPAAAKGIVAVSYARGKVTGGIRVGGTGDITKDAWAWKREGIGADSVSPVADGATGTFIVLNDSERPRGLVSCLDEVTARRSGRSNCRRRRRNSMLRPSWPATSSILPGWMVSSIAGTWKARG